MVEGSGFENRRGGNSTRGSNPFFSAKYDDEIRSEGRITEPLSAERCVTLLPSCPWGFRAENPATCV